jgi:hypothetical protein
MREIVDSSSLPALFVLHHQRGDNSHNMLLLTARET